MRVVDQNSSPESKSGRGNPLLGKVDDEIRVRFLCWERRMLVLGRIERYLSSSQSQCNLMIALFLRSIGRRAVEDWNFFFVLQFPLQFDHCHQQCASCYNVSNRCGSLSEDLDSSSFSTPHPSAMTKNCFSYPLVGWTQHLIVGEYIYDNVRAEGNSSYSCLQSPDTSDMSSNAQTTFRRVNFESFHVLMSFFSNHFAIDHWFQRLVLIVHFLASDFQWGKPW